MYSVVMLQDNFLTTESRDKRWMGSRIPIAERGAARAPSAGGVKAFFNKFRERGSFKQFEEGKLSSYHI
jgi:hypothetical protein